MQYLLPRLISSTSMTEQYKSSSSSSSLMQVMQPSSE